MLNITNAEASMNILKAVEAGTLVQGTWHGHADNGRAIACLLGSIHPKVQRAADCNGDLMPMWLAELTPILFDGIPAAEIAPIAKRYGQLVGRWHVLSSAQWYAILTRVLIRCVDDAVAAAAQVNEGKDYWPAVVAACDQVRAALQSGDAAELRAAESAARSAAESAAESAAWSAAKSAAGAARSAAWRAAWRAAESAAESAAWSAKSAAWSAAYLSLFHFVLDQIEMEL